MQPSTVIHLAHHISTDRVMCGGFIGQHIVTTNVDEVTCKLCKKTVAFWAALGGQR